MQSEYSQAQETQCASMEDIPANDFSADGLKKAFLCGIEDQRDSAISRQPQQPVVTAECLSHVCCWQLRLLQSADVTGSWLDQAAASRDTHVGECLCHYTR